MVKEESWTVEGHESDLPWLEMVESFTNEEEAIVAAQEMRDDYPEVAVMIRYFRSSDGKTTFLNKDGSYAAAGRPW